MTSYLLSCKSNPLQRQVCPKWKESANYYILISFRVNLFEMGGKPILTLCPFPDIKVLFIASLLCAYLCVYLPVNLSACLSKWGQMHFLGDATFLNMIYYKRKEFAPRERICSFILDPFTEET